jgi:hypothetical protein
LQVLIDPVPNFLGSAGRPSLTFVKCFRAKATQLKIIPVSAAFRVGMATES